MVYRDGRVIIDMHCVCFLNYYPGIICDRTKVIITAGWPYYWGNCKVKQISTSVEAQCTARRVAAVNHLVHLNLNNKTSHSCHGTLAREHIDHLNQSGQPVSFMLLYLW